ncbi:MAG: Uncharacterised protein [Cryomorphaceae bacterium]|nr:MAG: Uncharacterised protein [Cryomorphaceae bacterium]
MKKLLFIPMLLVAFTISAQNVTFGAKAGLNFTSGVGEGADGLDIRTAFHLGATAEIEMSESFSIQPELLYSGQGFTGNGDAIAKVDYINLPVMAKFYIGDGFSLEAGPQIGFLTSAKADIDGESRDIKDFLKSTDFALNLGAGYKLDSGLNFGLRYSMGLTDVPDGDFGDFKHRVLQLSVGYNF